MKEIKYNHIRDNLYDIANADSLKEAREYISNELKVYRQWVLFQKEFVRFGIKIYRFKVLRF